MVSRTVLLYDYFSTEIATAMKLRDQKYFLPSVTIPNSLLSILSIAVVFVSALIDPNIKVSSSKSLGFYILIESHRF